MMIMIEESEGMKERAMDLVEDIFRSGSLLRQILSEMPSERGSGEYGERGGRGGGGYGQRDNFGMRGGGGSYGQRDDFGMRGGGGGNYNQREWEDEYQGRGYSERRGVRGTGPYSMYR